MSPHVLLAMEALLDPPLPPTFSPLSLKTLPPRKPAPPPPTNVRILELAEWFSPAPELTVAPVVEGTPLALSP